MEQKTLKYLRILVPGIIIFLGSIPLLKELKFPFVDGKLIDYGYAILFSTIIGAIYYQSNFSFLLLNFSRESINKNILTKMLAICGISVKEEVFKDLLKQKRYLNVFYHFVDSDDSLTVKARNVYFNGLFWSSTADVFFISIIFLIIYKCWKTDFPNKEFYIIFLWIFIILSFILHIMSISKHKKLSDQQLDYLSIHYKEKLTAKLNEIL